jgi:hypothetical protein
LGASHNTAADEAGREYSYDDGAYKALQLATREGWLVVSMQDDWMTVFSLSTIIQEDNHA